MASIVRPSTPPPPSFLREPPTPRHAGDYEPYTPRKSSRISSQRAQTQRSAHTPPPPTSRNRMTSHLPSSTTPPSSTASTSKNPSSNSMATPLTIAKKRVAAFKDTRRVSGSLTVDTTITAASALGLPEPKPESSRRPTTVRNQGMLPTPDKTPKKRPSKPAHGISSIARNLFPARNDHIEEAMPSPRKNRKGPYSGFTLDSFGADDEVPSIQIYTDSHDRIPEVDTSEANPFYGEVVAVPEPTKRASKRRKIAVPGEGEQEIEDAEKRDDGLIYVFRGKKFYRKFNDDEDDSASIPDTAADIALDATVPARLRGSLTRSSIKPRLLFPPTASSSSARVHSLSMPPPTSEDEEALTDIEDAATSQSSPTAPATPVKLNNATLITPKAPRFAPASPPTTVRTTRSKKVVLDAPATPDAEGHVLSDEHDSDTPFNSWRSHKKAGISKKRGVDNISGSPAVELSPMKRARRGQATH